MQCYIYKSLNKQELYLFLDKKDDFSSIPDQILNGFGKLEFVMELEINSQRKLAREDVVKVLNSIEQKGYFIQLPPMLLVENFANDCNRLH